MMTLNRLTVARQGDIANGNYVETRIEQFDAKNRIKKVASEIPLPASAPSNLIPNGITEIPSGEISLQWEGDSEQYIVEFKQRGKAPVVFEVNEGKNQLTLNKDLFLEQAEKTSEDFQSYQSDAESNGQNSRQFLSSSGSYLWRVIGIKPTF